MEIRFLSGRHYRVLKGSHQEGKNLINEYHVYVLPKLSNFKEELLNYTWQKDRQSGEYINKPIDKFNHCMDAFRYSIMDAIQNKKAGFSIIYR